MHCVFARCCLDVLDFSLTNWVKNNTLRAGQELAEGALTLLLEQLNLTNFFKRPRCDRNRSPYIPSVQGIHNSKACFVFTFFFSFCRIQSCTTTICLVKNNKKLSGVYISNLVFSVFINVLLSIRSVIDLDTLLPSSGWHPHT